MQIIQVLRTMKWIGTNAAPFVKTLEAGLEQARPQSQDSRWFLSALYEHARLADVLAANPDAVQLLAAFGIEDALLKPDLMLKLAAIAERVIVGEPDSRSPDTGRLYNELHHMAYAELLTPLRRLMSCVQPLMKVAIPPELAGDDLPEDVLSVNLSDRESMTLGAVIKALSHIDALYDAVNRIHGNADRPPLQVLKIESGTSLRIDVKGLGEPIREIKDLIIEMWNKCRHKRVDEIIDHNRAVASSIMLLEEIDRQVKNRSLTGEDGNRFKRAVVTNTLGLFKDGALIQDIPLTEQVDNEKLLNSFGPKLLAAPERPDGPTRTSPVPAPAADLPKAEAPSRKRRSVRARRSIPKASEVG